ncbi:MAG TPA: hypothetical protein VK870_13505 [Ignavibacteriaceae bacterium]|nr:hypothetical protein [Ignavibacteriaceae bacterium]
MSTEKSFTKRELEILLHLLQHAEENIIRHELKINYEEFNISDIDKLRTKIKELIDYTKE